MVKCLGNDKFREEVTPYEHQQSLVRQLSQLRLVTHSSGKGRLLSSDRIKSCYLPRRPGEFRLSFLRICPYVPIPVPRVPLLPDQSLPFNLRFPAGWVLILHYNSATQRICFSEFLALCPHDTGFLSRHSRKFLVPHLDFEQ